MNKKAFVLGLVVAAVAVTGIVSAITRGTREHVNTIRALRNDVETLKLAVSTAGSSAASKDAVAALSARVDKLEAPQSITTGAISKPSPRKK